MKLEIFTSLIIVAIIGYMFVDGVKNDCLVREEPKIQYKNTDYFIPIEENTKYYDSKTGLHYQFVYAKDTKVKYVIATSHYQAGITPLYNADGTLQLYEEETSE